MTDAHDCRSIPIAARGPLDRECVTAALRTLERDIAVACAFERERARRRRMPHAADARLIVEPGRAWLIRRDD